MKKLLILLLLANPALADVKSNGRTIECYCTDRHGDRVELGDMICLHVDGKMFMAQCQMSLNNPMWRKITDGCLSSSLRQTPKPPVNAISVDAKI